MLRTVALLLLVLPASCTHTGGADGTDPEDGEELGNDVADSADIVPLSATPVMTTRRFSSPRRTSVYDGSGKWLATFTNGARTVRLRGASRIFAEPATTTATVTTNNWVRLLGAPFTGTIDYDWLDAALADTSPDILAVAMQYTSGAQSLMSGIMQLSGDAAYGPLVDGLRQEGSDFNDYLGISWRYPTGTVVDPDPTQLKSLDCSGFQRMVWGYRGGLELVLTPRTDGSALPRRSSEIYASGPGIVTVPNTGAQVTDFTVLATGDLVFSDASSDDGTQVDHVGIYLGIDSEGHRRYLSSRKTANGPTMGDVGGKSILDGTTYLYARTFRAVRRL